MEQRKKISFGFSLADEKIKLIDILSEDDNFLVSSPFSDPLEDFFFSGPDHGGFRLSGFGNFEEVEKNQQKEHNLLPSDHSSRPERPSFLRRSLAWDNAFFDGAGVLDPDELSLINKGFRNNEAYLLSETRDVRKRRPESDSMKHGDGFSLDWIEINPFYYNSDCSELVNMVINESPESRLEQEGMQNVKALKKVHKSFLCKMKSNQTSSGKSINVQTEEKTKNETTCRRKQRTILSPKPPVTLGRTKNRDFSAKLDIKMENKSATTDTGTSLVMEKKPASQSSPTASIALSSSAPFIDMCISGSSPQPSTLLKRNMESRRSKLSSSLSASKMWRHSETGKGMISCPSFASSTRHCSSEPLMSFVSSKQRSNESEIGLDIKKTSRGTFLHNDAKEASNLHSNLPSPLSSSRPTGATCSACALAAKDSRPSGLRPPSPRIRFFNENTPPEYHEVTTSRKLSRKVLSGGTSFGANTYSELLLAHSNSSRNNSDCKKLKSPCSEVATNIKRPKTNHTNTFLGMDKEMCLETERIGDQENEKRNPSSSGDHLGNLRKYFEAIDLNQENKEINGQFKRNKINIENKLLDSPTASSKPQQLSPKALVAADSILSTRTPLADRTSACNLSEALASPMEPTKENLVQKASSVYSSSEVTNKGIMVLLSPDNSLRGTMSQRAPYNARSPIPQSY